MNPRLPTITLPLKHAVLILLCSFFVAGCDKLFDQSKDRADAKSANSVSAPKVNQDNLLSAANLYVYTQLSEALSHAQTLDRVIASFLHHPNPLSLEECQQAWIKTYQAYLKVNYFYKVPRFEKPQFIEQNQTYEEIHLLLDMWPIEGGYIDYLPGYPLSGIINDMTLKISEDALLDQHGFSEFSYASVGFHPLEFLLFGDEGKRSAKDFIPKENSIEVVSIDSDDHNHDGEEEGTDHTERQEADPKLTEAVSEEVAVRIQPQNHNRRREYLRILSALLVSNLQKLTDRWEPAHGYYAKSWRHPDTQRNLQRLYQTAIDHLQTDILAQHIQPLLLADELEEMRSPYSDTDIENIYAMVEGIKLWWLYENSMQTELKVHEAELANDIEKQFMKVLAKLEKVPKNVVCIPLKKRKSSVEPIQKSIIKLLEQLYGSAQVIGINLAPLPLSHE